MDPKSLKYTPSHEWVSLDGDIATVGISKFAVEQLTDLILIDLGKAKPGSTLRAGQVFGEIESVKAVSDLYAPVGGEVLEVNSALSSDISLLADDPFGQGWLLKLKVSEIPDDLLDHDAYTARLAEDAH